MLPIVCGTGHEHDESLTRLTASRLSLCEILRQPVEVKNEDRDAAQRVIEGFKSIRTEVDYPLTARRLFA